MKKFYNERFFLIIFFLHILGNASLYGNHLQEVSSLLSVLKTKLTTLLELASSLYQKKLSEKILQQSSPLIEEEQLRIDEKIKEQEEKKHKEEQKTKQKIQRIIRTCCREFPATKEANKFFPEVLAVRYFASKDKFKDYEYDEPRLLTEEEKKVLYKHPYYKKILEQCEEYESSLKNLKNDPSVSLFGGINYAMTFEEMKEAVKKIFQIMKKNGLIVTEKEFMRIKDQYYTKSQHTDLTRIWGAEYLKSKINASEELSKKYAIPDYIIVVKNLDAIEVSLWFNIVFPIVGYLENAFIFFKKIEGVPVGCDSQVIKDIGKDSVIGYVDLCTEPLSHLNKRQHENVIKNSKDGLCYIVDTEYSSFHTPSQDSKTKDSLLYGAKKFEHINNVRLTDYWSIKIRDKKNEISLSINL